MRRASTKKLENKSDALGVLFRFPKMSQARLD